MSLQSEITEGRATVKPESLSMSIGEVVNLYREQELVIRPEFQRLFRWRSDQKSRLIESLLLGIPLPSIFVMQRHDGVWEVIDGLQRLSTILEFVGELRNEETQDVLPPSSLVETAYLPSLEGVYFESEDLATSLTPGQRVGLKRSKLDFKILLPESDDRAKYELFDRLNSGGSTTSAQEVRTCQLIMRNRSFFQWLDALRGSEDFIECALVSSKQTEEQYDLELVCRFFCLTTSSADELLKMVSVDAFLTKRMLDVASKPEFDRARQRDVFLRTFAYLRRALGAQAFRRYDAEKGRFLGGFSVSAFEAITTGISSNLDGWDALEESASSSLIRDKVIGLWNSEDFRRYARAGVRGTTRIPAVVNLSVEQFRPGT